jgi:hypothetical protein
MNTLQDHACSSCSPWRRQSFWRFLLPGSFSPQGLPQTLIGLRRRVQAGQELGHRLWGSPR